MVDRFGSTSGHGTVFFDHTNSKSNKIDLILIVFQPGRHGFDFGSNAVEFAFDLEHFVHRFGRRQQLGQAGTQFAQIIQPHRQIGDRIGQIVGRNMKITDFAVFSK